MKIVFMGTPEFAATILEELAQHHEVVATYTRPDAVRGRGKALIPSPVKQVALEEGIPLYEPRSLFEAEEIARIEALQPDAICVAAYGLILPPAILSIPKYGCLNVHASLLPHWRGAAPVEYSILAGEEETGVCVMKMEEGLDEGDYCICRTAQIEEKNVTQLSDELANLGSHALLTALVHIEQGVADWIVQDPSQATYAPKIRKNQLKLSPKGSAQSLVRAVRASSATHPSRCVFAGKPVTVVALCSIENDDHAQELCSSMMPGSVTYREKRLFMGCADGAVEVQTIKPDGKQEMSAQAFASGIQNIKTAQLTWGELEA